MVIGRDKELRQLETFFQNPMHLKVARIEGRPGSGKTALCRQFVADKPSIAIWDPSPVDNAKNLLKAGIATQAFLRSCAGERMPVIRIPDDGFASWGRFFCALCAISAATERRVTLVLDRYDALCAADPSFAMAFEAAVDALWATHLFALITGEHDALGACATPAQLDPILAQTTNAIQLRGLGPKAADLAHPATALERIGAYAERGGLPGRYCAKGRPATGAGAAGGAVGAEGQPDAAAVLRALAAAPCPTAGLTADELAAALGVSRLQALRPVKDLRRQGMVESVPCFSCIDGAERCVERLRVADPADLAELTGSTGCADERADRLDLAFLDMGRAWLWEALRGGDFPFEFERVGWWYDDASRAGDAEPWGVIGVNGHYRRAVCTKVLDPVAVLTRQAVDDLVARTESLPYKKPYCAALCATPVVADVLAYAADIDNLIVAELRADGFVTVSAPWKAKSPRYQAAVAAAACAGSSGAVASQRAM